MPVAQKKYELIDYLKGFAIFTIVVYHALQRIPLSELMANAIRLGGTGVHLFLLLSGLGLYLSHQNKKLSYPQFLRKRFLKIYIPYILIVLLSALLGLFLPLWDVNSWYALGGHVFLYKMFDNSIIGSYGYQLWFLSVILQFYLIFHVLAWFKEHSRNRSFLATGLLISFAWGALTLVLGKSELRNWNSFFLQYLWEFMLGMSIASWLYTERLHPKLKPLHYLGVSLVFLLAFALMSLKGGAFGKVFNDIPALFGYSLLAVFIYLLKLKPLNAFFLYTGKISFSLFLVHMLIMNLLWYLFKANGMNMPVVGIVGGIGLSYFFGHYYHQFVIHIYRLLKI